MDAVKERLVISKAVGVIGKAGVSTPGQVLDLVLFLMSYVAWASHLLPLGPPCSLLENRLDQFCPRVFLTLTRLPSKHWRSLRWHKSS